MQSEKKGEYYVIEVICENIHVLLPLNDITKVISRKEIELSQKHKKMVIFEENEYYAVSLSQLLKRNDFNKETYGILIQNDSIEFILLVDEIESIRVLDEASYNIPAYLKTKGIDYIIKCYIRDEQIAYQIDFIKLLNRFYNS